MTAAFGPGGLRRLGLDAGVDDDPLNTFPIAFRHGMGNPNAGASWTTRAATRRTSGRGSPQKPVDVVIVCYAEQPEGLETEVAAVKRKTTGAGMKIVAELPLAVNRDPPKASAKASNGAESGDRPERGLAYEHFGFVDGISQPIVRGTRAPTAGRCADASCCARRVPVRLSRRARFYPASPSVRASHDRTASCWRCAATGRSRPAAASARLRPQRLVPRRTPVRAARRQLQ